jgi:diguanylate cyclase (GGDEF)-like protein
LQELKRNYNRDALTGIGNRREAERVMGEYSVRMYTTGKIFCIVSLDMDGLKIINDKYGHLQGDEALCVVARILKEVVGENGSAARIGGDEYAAFAFVEVPDIQEILKRRIAQYFDDLNQKSGKPYFITVSLGMYKFNCGPKVALSDVMKHTDESLRENKKNKPSGIMKPTKLSLTI